MVDKVYKLGFKFVTVLKLCLKVYNNEVKGDNYELSFTNKWNNFLCCANCKPIFPSICYEVASIV